MTVASQTARGVDRTLMGRSIASWDSQGQAANSDRAIAELVRDGRTGSDSGIFAP
ncbi:hypothetical protein [Baaleninema sp.]|uniref:hypothetical protein n=1 Tax=Baaleninema sp. TaxID=3101197 RepID=UPI003D025F0D